MHGQFVTAWVVVGDLAARQHGVISYEQLVGAGVGPGAIDHATRSGRLHRLHVGVYAVGHRPPSREARWMAAVLACGPGAVLSHRSAATLWGFREAETRNTDVTIAPGSGRRRPAIAVHRSPLHHDDRTTHKHIPTTTPERTLIDLTTQLDDDDVARATREAQFRRQLHLPSLQRALDRRPSRLVRSLLHDQLETRSHLEDAFMRLLDRHGIRRSARQTTVLGHRVDFLWPRERVVVETDGWEGHSTPAAFQLDRAQTNAISSRATSCCGSRMPTSRATARARRG